MGSTQHESFHDRTSPSAICAGDTFGDVRTAREKVKMVFLKDGSKETGGYAPYASRFTDGAYIHGVPVNEPRKTQIEYSWSLGTTPRSHMCVRNATSHAKFILTGHLLTRRLFLFWNKIVFIFATFLFLAYTLCFRKLSFVCYFFSFL